MTTDDIIVFAMLFSTGALLVAVFQIRRTVLLLAKKLEDLGL